MNHQFFLRHSSPPSAFNLFRIDPILSVQVR
jgi:hypothetical protein